MTLPDTKSETPATIGQLNEDMPPGEEKKRKIMAKYGIKVNGIKIHNCPGLCAGGWLLSVMPEDFEKIGVRLYVLFSLKDAEEKISEFMKPTWKGDGGRENPYISWRIIEHPREAYEIFEVEEEE